MKSRFKIFLMSMCFTFLFLIFFICLIIVDKNTKQIALGDNTPILSIEKENEKFKRISLNFFGNHFEINKITYR